MNSQAPNISVASNIWICVDDPRGPGNNQHAASRVMPGDLAFKILIPDADTRTIQQAVLDGTITRKQAKEREFFRHFAPHNHLDDPKVTSVHRV